MTDSGDQVLVHLLTEQVADLIDALPPEMRDAPGEVQLHAHFPHLADHAVMLLGTAILHSDGSLTDVVAWPMYAYVAGAGRVPKKMRHYVFAILRRVAEPRGLCYLVILPPDEVREVVVDSPTQRQELFAVLAEIPSYVAAAMEG